VVSVIASSIRKGNVVDKDGKLYVVIRAENIHPGKGTPVTHLEMRRISDGVKVQERYKTTDSVEKAFIDDGKYNYLYQDGDMYHFMNNETFEQVGLSADVLGDAVSYLLPNIKLAIEFYESRPVGIELPLTVEMKVLETEPARPRDLDGRHLAPPRVPREQVCGPLVAGVRRDAAGGEEPAVVLVHPGHGLVVLVPPQGEHGPRLEHPERLGHRALRVGPVEGLGVGDQVEQPPGER